MIYMAAGDSPELDAHAVRDLREMELATLPEDVEVVVQINRYWPQLPQRYALTSKSRRRSKDSVAREFEFVGVAEEVDPGNEGLPADAETSRPENMGTRLTFRKFLAWAHDHTRRDAGRKCFLILWGHAYGLGFGRDHGDALTLDELAIELDTFSRLRERKLELLGANACAMSYAEAAFQLSTAVDFLVASEIAVPFAGWPYDAILARLTGDMQAEDAGKLVVDRYVTHYDGAGSNEQVAMTLLDLGQAGALKGLIDELAVTLTRAIADPSIGASDRLVHVRNAFLATAAGDVRPLLDLIDLCGELSALCDDLEVLESGSASTTLASSLGPLRRAVQKVLMVLDPASPLLPHPKQTRSALIRHHDHHEALLDLHGLAIFAPFVTDERDLKRLGLTADGRKEYAKLRLFAGTTPERSWESLVYDRLAMPLPADVILNAQASGAMTVEARSAVVQMLVAIDSIFATFDRRMAASHRRVRSAIGGFAGVAGNGGPIPPTLGEPLRALDLFRRFGLDLLSPAQTNGVKKMPAKAPAKVQAASSSAMRDVVDAFESLERMLADLERALKRTLTNASFGLGPARDDSDGPKPSLGAGDPKPSLGVEPKPRLGVEPKPRLGVEPKPRLGVEPKPRLGAAGGSDSGTGTAVDVVASLFSDIGLALRQLEASTADVELVTARLLLGQSGLRSAGSRSDVEAAEREVDRAFAALADASTDARRTMQYVLAHPAYGFGPGAERITLEDRRALARAGGLNNEELTLL